MKRSWIFLAFIVIVIQSYFVLAQTCDPDQIIFKASSQVNAHVAVWDESSGAYNYDLCFSSLFDSNFTGANPHDLANLMDGDTNIVARFYSSSNSHLQAPNESSYPVQVFFGDLHCEVRSTFNSCEGLVVNGNHYGATLGALDSWTNSHFTFGLPAGAPYRLCCASESAFPVDSDTCGNGVVDNLLEECDGADMNGWSDCSQLEGWTGGQLVCGGNCKLDTSGCTQDLSCTQYITDSSGDFSITVNETVYNDVSELHCELFNQLTLEDKTNAGFSGSLEEYKEYMCGTCNSIPSSVLCSRVENENENVVCSAAKCEWDGDECKLDFINAATGSSCTTEILSDSGCAPGQLTKTIVSSVSCSDGENYESTATINCPRVVQLPFFSALNFIIAILIIAAIYAAYHYKLKK